MDLFPAQGRITPLEAPTESPAIRAFLQGLTAGKEIPTATTALADAVTTGIQSYDKQVETKQRQKINDINIENAELGLEERRELQPEEIQARKEVLALEQDKRAEEYQMRAEKEELMGILQSGDDDAATEAVISNKYARVFAADPKLEEIATRRALVNADADTRSVMLKQKGSNALANMYARKQLAFDTAHQKAEGSYLESDFTKRVIARNKGLDERTLAKNVTFVPAGSVEIKDGVVVIDPETKQYKTKEGYDPAVKNTQLPNTSIAIDSRTGAVWDESVSKEDEKIVHAYQGTARAASQSFLRSSNSEALVEEAMGRGGKTPQRPTTEGEAEDANATGNAVERLLSPKNRDSTEGNIDLPALRKSFNKVPLLNSNGSPELNTPTVRDLFARSLDLPKVINQKYRTRLGEYLSKTVSVMDKPNTAVVASYKADRLQEKADIINDMLADDFELKNPSAYTYEKVSAHNLEVDKYRESLAAGESVLPPKAGNVYVSSPQELYIEERKPALWSRMGFAAREIHEAGKEQKKARAKAGVRRNSALVVAESIK